MHMGPRSAPWVRKSKAMHTPKAFHIGSVVEPLQGSEARLLTET